MTTNRRATAEAIVIVMLAGLFELWLSRSLYGDGDYQLFIASAATWRQYRHFWPHPGHAPNANLPHVTLLFVPLTFLPIAVGKWLFVGLNLAAIADVVRRRDWPTWAVAFLAVSPPFVAATVLAQPIGLLTWMLDREYRQPRVGWLGLAVAFKPYLLPLLAWEAVHKKWTVVATAALAAGAWFTIGVLVCGWPSYREWSMFVGITERTVGLQPANISLWARLPHGMAALAVLGVVGLTVVATWRASRACAWSAILLASVLISPLGWTYYGLTAITCIEPTWGLLGLFMPAAFSPATVGWLVTWTEQCHRARRSGRLPTRTERAVSRRNSGPVVLIRPVVENAERFQEPAIVVRQREGL